MNTQHSDFITRTRQSATKLLDAVNELRALEQQRLALDLVNQLEANDFVGQNAGLAQADVAGVTTTLAALESLLAQGHATNLYKVKL